MRPPRELSPIILPSPKRRVPRRYLLVAGAIALAACSDVPVPTNPSPATPGSIAASTRSERATAPATLAWELTARNLVSAHPATMTPIVATRVYALLGMAQYGAAVASDRALGIAGDEDDAPLGADDGGRAQYESRRGAIGEASRMVLAALFPDAAQSLKDQLDVEAIGPNGRIHPQFSSGKDIGHAMGVVMNTWASTDGFSTPWNQVPWLKDPLKPAQWYQASPTSPPAGYQFPAMRPYFMTSPAQFHPAPPPAFGSARFLADLQTVRDIAASRTAEQVRIANFWNLPQGTPTALGHWDEIAAGYITGHALGDRSASHIYALTNAAALDATIGCWEAKYTYVLLRPFQNPGGVETLFTTPNHPSYPSGHSCASGASATVLAHFFPEKASELDAMVIEAGDSRVYAGIHYPFDVETGRALGRAVGQWALDFDHTHGVLTAVGR